MSEIVLYRAERTRSFTALWMLEELGVPYRSEIVPGNRDARRTPDYLKLNPTGMIPTLVDGQTVVRETAAICLHLADRYGAGTLAPLGEEPDRGPYLSWLIYAVAQLEPAAATSGVDIPMTPGFWGAGWQKLMPTYRILADALEQGPYLLGERFSAADVMLGSVLILRFHTREIPADPKLKAYSDRLGQRPAAQRAAAMNWPANTTAG